MIWLTGWTVDICIGGTSFCLELCSSWSLQSCKRSTSKIVDGLLRFDLFLVLGFLPAIFGAPPNAILVIHAPDLDLLYQVIKSSNWPYFSATAIVCFRTSIYTILVTFKGSSFSRCSTVDLVCMASNNVRSVISARHFYMPQQFTCFFKDRSKNYNQHFSDSTFHGSNGKCARLWSGGCSGRDIIFPRSHICFLKFLALLKCSNPYLSRYGPFPKTALS